MQTPRKVPYIGPRSRRLDEISGLDKAVAKFRCIKKWLICEMASASVILFCLMQCVNSLPKLRSHKIRYLACISQAFPLRAGKESANYESAQYLSGDGVLKHIEVDNNEQTRSLPAIGSRSRNKLEKCELGAHLQGQLPVFGSYGQGENQR